MIKKVLLATDGSQHADKAVALGSDLAARYGAEVVLVHVLLRHELPDDMRRMAAVEHLASSAPLPSAAIPAVDLANIMDMRGGRPTVSDAALQAIGERILEHAEQVAPRPRRRQDHETHRGWQTGGPDPCGSEVGRCRPDRFRRPRSVGSRGTIRRQRRPQALSSVAGHLPERQVTPWPPRRRPGRFFAAEIVCRSLGLKTPRL